MFCIIDIESTGLHPEYDRITEVALIRIDGTKIVSEESFLINPECRLAPGITNLTGITQDMVDAAPRFFQVAKRIVELSEGCVLVGHNVRFDYAFLCGEFNRLGFSFRRPQICTLRLLRQREGKGRHDLESACSRYGIVRDERHRALADARATAALFLKLSEPATTPQEFLKEHRHHTRLPPGMQEEAIARLPEKTGVYYFYDENDTLLYVGKSLHLRSRVLAHFAADLRDSRERRLKEQVHRIEHRVTGSELLALLLESAEIKEKLPLFNRRQRSERAVAGLYLYEHPASPYLELLLCSVDEAPPEAVGPLRSFPSFTRARSYLDHFVKSYELCPHFTRLHLRSRPRRKGPCFDYHLDSCHGPCCGVESATSYNARLEEAAAECQSQILGEIFGPEPSVLVLEGRRRNEKGLIWMDPGGVYRGFGFWDLKKRGLLSFSEVSAQRDAWLKEQSENSDTQSILRSHLNAERETIEVLTEKGARPFVLADAVQLPASL